MCRFFLKRSGTGTIRHINRAPAAHALHNTATLDITHSSNSNGDVKLHPGITYSVLESTPSTTQSKLHNSRILANDFLDDKFTISITWLLAIIIVLLFWILLYFLVVLIRRRNQQKSSINFLTNAPLPKKCSLQVKTCRIITDDCKNLQNTQSCTCHENLSCPLFDTNYINEAIKLNYLPSCKCEKKYSDRKQSLSFV